MTQTNNLYDVVVIGGGPAGLTAGLYLARARYRVLILEKDDFGGQITITNEVVNYPGVGRTTGRALTQTMRQQAQDFGAEFLSAEAIGLDVDGDIKTVHTSRGDIKTFGILIATGASPRKLGFEGEAEYAGRGVAYCAACDGMFYKGKTVVVVGGGNSAAADALLLSRVAKKVILVHRRDTLRATKIYHEPLAQAENVEFRWNSVVSALLSGDRLTGVRLRDTVTGEESVVDCDGVFVSVGRQPATALAVGQLELDGGGYIVAGETTETSIPGVYAVGDVRTKPLRQVVTAVADGAVAVHMAEKYIAENR